jgi:oligopeptide/dipeptide ABC transporter ATP-binding protein
MSPTPLLQIDDLAVDFIVRGQRLTAVRGLTMQVGEAEAVGLVGESACGKSVSMLAVLGLLGSNARVRGTIRYRGEVIDTPQKVAALRGSRVAMVFQDSMNSLNPLMKVGVQVAEVIRRHRKSSRAEAAAEAVRYLDRVRLPSPRDLYNAYPFELSGGMRQRVMIASALACDPELLIADEPTTGLDVTVQAGILDLLVELRSTAQLAVVFVSHDIGAVGELCDNVYVFYGGRAVERGPTAQLLNDPRHPYTRALLASVPVVGDRRRLLGIDGLPPGPQIFPPGCSFSPRCEHAIGGRCDITAPPLVQLAEDRDVECWLEVAAVGVS